MAGLCWLMSDKSASAALRFFSMASKSSGPSGSSSPASPSSSLSSAVPEPMLGLMPEGDESRALLPANLMPRLPSRSSKSSSSPKPAGGSAAFGLRVNGAFPISMSLSQSSSTFCREGFFPSLLIVPPSNALDGMFMGMGTPACLAD